MYSNLRRLYINQRLIQNSKINLIGNQYHYLRNVLRSKENEFIRLFNGQDGEWLAKILKFQKKTILLEISKKIADQKNSLDLWLLFSPIKKNRLNILIQKATELGINYFIPVDSERTNLKNIKISNLQYNAIEAAEQCERLDVPEVGNLIKISKINDLLLKDRCLIFCDESDKKLKNIINEMTQIKKKYKKWSLIVGPEGGFSEKEKKQLLNLKNTHSVSLGKRILRSDTAVTVALYCIQQFADV